MTLDTVIAQEIKDSPDNQLIDIFLDAQHDERYAATEAERTEAREQRIVAKAEIDRRGIQ